MKSTNMSCLTPDAALSGDCDFLSANMYARSLFGKCFIIPLSFNIGLTRDVLGEDALANLSIEKIEGTGNIQGHVRIRSKTQGIALSLGDKITLGETLKVSRGIFLTIHLLAQKEVAPLS
jgi:coatomer subunit beta